MLDTLILTAAERAVYDALPATLKADWKVQTESQTAYETDYQLMVRANMAELEPFPALKKIATDIRAGKQPDLTQVGQIPGEAIPELLFSIGARGITALIGHMLPRATRDEDIRAIAGFTFFRHDILKANAKFAPSPR